MNIKAELPDGTVLEFPEGTDEAVIDGVVKQHLAQSQLQPDSNVPWTNVPIPYQAAAPGAKNVDYTGAPGELETFLRATGKGALLGYGDEIGGAIGGYVPGLLSGKDAEAEYRRVRDQYRAQDREEARINPASAIAGNVTGQVATGAGATLATGGTSLPAVLGLGAAQGAATGLGESEATDLRGMGKDALKGGAFGLGGAAVGYAGGKILEKLINRGIAYATIQKAVDGNTNDLLREMTQKGISAAEADDVLKEILRGQATKNPTAATAVIPQAQQRMTQVGQQTISDVNQLVSPENAAQYIEQLQKQGQQIGAAGYQAAYANPKTVSLLPNVAGNPAVQPAIAAAEKLAAVQGRPFDVNALTVQDLDAIQRALANYSKNAFAGDSVDTLLGPSYSQFSGDINRMATNMATNPAESLGVVQQQYAAVKAAQDAVELGQKALNPSKEFVEVADEFAKLSPQEQQGYLAGVATKLRTMLQQKSNTSNPGTAFNKEAVIEKLKAVGFPPDAIDQIVQRGKDARGVLDALIGGSDTAKKLAGMDASKSALSKFAESASKDLTTVGVTGQPGFLALIPGLRALGGAQDRAVADTLIKALTEQSGQKLRGILDYAPQTVTTPLLGLLSRGTGGYFASQK